MFTGGDFSEFFKGLFILITVLSVMALFGIWKLVEIVLWLFSHISIH